MPAGRPFEFDFQPLPTALEAKPWSHTLIDIDLTDDTQIFSIKHWLSGKRKDTKVIFAIDKGSWLQEARASALGASAVIQRPIDIQVLLSKIWNEEGLLATVAATPDQNILPGIAAGVSALQSRFSAASIGARVDATAVQTASNAVVDQLEAQGLASWIEAVRMHHSRTYQHCLLVTGVAVAFGEHLGVSRKDRQRLSFAGMLHDIGKARIPLAISRSPVGSMRMRWP